MNWNWAAGLLTPYWFFYRKMYLWGILFYLLIMIIFFFGWPIAIILSGCLGNYLYKKHVESKINSITLLAGNDESLLRRLLIEKGGTSWLAVILFIGVVFLFFFFVGILMSL